MDNAKFKSAVITVLTAQKENFLNNPLMHDDLEKYAASRIEKAINAYKKGFITADEALKIGIHPLKTPLEL